MQLVEKLMTWMKLTFVEVPTHSLYRIHVKRVERSTKSTKCEIQKWSCILIHYSIYYYILMYWFPFRQRRPEKAIGVHIQLTGALLCLHLSFLLCSHWVLLLTVDEEDWICKGLGLWLHWSLLATFSWTALEGFHIYLLLVRVFNIYVRRYMLKISLVGWGEWSLLFCQMCKCFCLFLFTYNVLGDLKIPSLHSPNGIVLILMSVSPLMLILFIVLT